MTLRFLEDYGSYKKGQEFTIIDISDGMVTFDISEISTVTFDFVMLEYQHSNQLKRPDNGHVYAEIV